MTKTTDAGRAVDRLKVVEMNGRCYLMIEDSAFAIATTAKFDVVTDPEIIRAEAQALVHRWNCHADLVKALEAAEVVAASAINFIKSVCDNDADWSERALKLNDEVRDFRRAALAASKTGGE